MCSSKVKRYLLIPVSVILVISIAASLAVNAKRVKKTFVLPDTSTAEISTNRHTQYSQAAAIAGNRMTTDGFEKTLENDALELWLSEELASIRVIEKKSGYVWGMLPTATVEDLNDYWIDMAQSIMTLEYYDSDNNMHQISLRDPSFMTEYTVDESEGTLTCMAECDDAGIDLGFTITLAEDHIEVAVLEDSLQEYDVNMLSKVYLLPFFGCTARGEMDGYFFVPDGSGALMRFDSSSIYDASYHAKLYGADAGIDTINQVADLMANRSDDYLVDEFRATIPVYGVVHGAEQYAAMTVVEDGCDYATIQASLAGTTVPYNWITTYFEYRQLYNQPVSKTNTIIRPQPQVNDMQPRFSIYLLSGTDASYNGMALKYRSLLEDAGILAAEAETYEEIPLRLEVLCADVKAGFIFDSTTTFTTVDEAKKMQSDLDAMGIHQLTMVLNGWEKGGASAHKYTSYASQRSVGSMSELASLRDGVVSAGGNFYLQSRVVTLNESQGKLAYLSDMTLSKKLSFYLRDNPSVMFQRTYIAAPQTVVSQLQTAMKKLSGFNLNLPRFGSELYSDHKADRTSTRAETRETFAESAAALRENGQKLALSAPNVYMWESCTDYFDIPMMNSQYLMESDAVPFLQMLLKGHINYYAPYANQGFYTTACTLKSIEYGAYPSFLVMGADNGELRGTPMVDYFSLNFEDWKGTIDTVYGKCNAALKEVEDAYITEHKVLSQGVVRVTYSNGVKIYVNYNAFECKADTVTIPGLNFTVERG